MLIRRRLTATLPAFTPSGPTLGPFTWDLPRSSLRPITSCQAKMYMSRRSLTRSLTMTTNSPQ